MQKWEYKVLDHVVDEKEVNQLGLLGWELVAVTATGSGFIYLYTFLKRLISN
jgi:hypothetical protein